ncbi:hypothetical protein D3C81_1694910 [compost metagenome]
MVIERDFRCICPTIIDSQSGYEIETKLFVQKCIKSDAVFTVIGMNHLIYDLLDRTILSIGNDMDET